VGAEGPEHRTIPYGEALTSSETLQAIGRRLHTLRRDEHLSSAKERLPSEQTAKFVDHQGVQNAASNDQARRQVGPHLTVRERTRPHVAEPSYPRNSSKRARLLGGPHLGVHSEPLLQRLEVGPVGISEAHVVLLLDRFEEHCRGFQLL
jgi:hypothetical protein